MEERPYVAILPLGIEVEITKLSEVKSVEENLSPEDEAQQLADAPNRFARKHGGSSTADWRQDNDSNLCLMSKSQLR